MGVVLRILSALSLRKTNLKLNCSYCPELKRHKRKSLLIKKKNVLWKLEVQYSRHSCLLFLDTRTI